MSLPIEREQANAGAMAGTYQKAAPWLWLSMVAAVAAGVGSVIGLAAYERIYGAETEYFVDQALAQDIVNLFVITPGVLVLASLALRGSLPAFLAWIGFLAFTIYNYEIYTFSISFGPLFLLWVAVFGAALFCAIGAFVSVDAEQVRVAFHHRPARFTAGFLVFVTTAFGVMWLLDIVPALVDGTAPEGAVDMGLPTNPVHVLDLAFFLPAVAAVGVALWRRRALGYVAGPGMLLFLALTGIPIIVTVFVADARGHEATWFVLVPIGTVAVISVWLAGRLLLAPRPSANPDESVGSGAYRTK